LEIHVAVPYGHGVLGLILEGLIWKIRFSGQIVYIDTTSRESLDAVEQ
jgi:hypothetical protein